MGVAFLHRNDGPRADLKEILNAWGSPPGAAVEKPSGKHRSAGAAAVAASAAGAAREGHVAGEAKVSG